MILVIDVGNTRLKWAWLTSTGLSDQQAVVHRDAKPGIWTTAPFESGQRPSRVLVSNVAGPVMAKMLTRLTKKMFRVDIEFVTAAREFHGLTSGYLDPSLLGADRWLALIGAWTRVRTALCVVDAGTAVKVDSVDSSGQHLGGLIAPGIHMMREALLSNTSDIAKAAFNSTPSLAGVLANNTIAAASRGAVFALAGMAGSCRRGHRAEHRHRSEAVHYRRRCQLDRRNHANAWRNRSRTWCCKAWQSSRRSRAKAVFRPGARNLISDVAGLTVGHATDEEIRAPASPALLCTAGWVASVDIRGGGPGTRETDALASENLVGRAHALVLAGGSVFGLAAADGVAAALSVQGTGLQWRPKSPAIPIVPSAVLHDLGNGGDKNWGLTPPYRELGIRAAAAAVSDFTLGSVGAGRGAMAGLLKGGIGSASVDLHDGLIVGALVAVNSVGSPLMPDGRTYWAWAFELGQEFGGGGPPQNDHGFLSDPAPDESRLLAIGRLTQGANTTLAAVACNADLSTAECKRVAMMAHDGIARALRPAHTPFDGDTVFALASGELTLEKNPLRPAQVGRIGSAAADCLARAIARGVHEARTRG